MNNDLISRSALLERLAFKRMGSMQRNTYPGLESAIAQVKKAPAVDAETVCEQLGLVKQAFDMAKANLVPVVWCKDCKHRDPEDKRCDHPVSAGCPFERKDFDFCSYGERRGGDADLQAQ